MRSIKERAKTKKSAAENQSTTDGVVIYLKISRAMHTKLIERAVKEDRTLSATIRQALAVAYGS